MREFLLQSALRSLRMQVFRPERKMFLLRLADIFVSIGYVFTKNGNVCALKKIRSLKTQTVPRSEESFVA